MKISAIASNPQVQGYESVKNVQTVSLPKKNNATVLAFKGGNPRHLFHQISELSMFGMGAGGVGTVGNDLFYNIKDFDRVVENIPLYNQEVVYRKEIDSNGKVTGVSADGVKLRKIPEKLPEGHPFKPYEGSVFVTKLQIGADQNLAEVLAKNDNYNKVFILDEIGSSKMEWGLEKDIPISIFKAKKDDKLKEFLRKEKGWTDEMINKIDITFTYVDATASMAKPYADGSYSFATGDKVAQKMSANWQGKPYPKEAKATAELLPFLKENMGGFDPKFIACHDGQAMPLIQFIAEKNAAGIDFYKEKVLTAIGHNLCDGYMYELSTKDAIVCLAKPGELEKIINSKEYIEALQAGREESFLRSLLPKELLNSRNEVNAVMFPIAYGDTGFVPMFTTVSDGYYRSIITNEEVSPALFARLKALSEKGRFKGILNVLNDPNTSGFTTDGLGTYYKNDCIVQLADGTVVTFPKFLAFNESEKYDLAKMREVKRNNKLSLLKRLNPSLEDSKLKVLGKDKTFELMEKGTGFSAAVTGGTGRKFDILGGIDKKYIEMLEQGKDVPMFVSWGRGDFQKGMDTALESFAKFMEKNPETDAIFIFGGDMSNIREDVSKLMKKYTEKGGLLEGKVLCLDGWAPGSAFAAAGDYAILTSRFAPCELTDLESMKKGCVPIVPKVQGMDQKVFDPTDTAHSAVTNGYKGEHEYFMSEAEAYKAANEPAKSEFNQIKDKLVKTIKEDYSHKTGEKEVPEEYIRKQLLNKQEYKKALSKLRDSVISDDISKVLERAMADRNTEKANTIWKNHVDLKTNWFDNGILNPNGKATGELYREFHFNPSYGKNLNQGEELKLNISSLTDIYESGSAGGGNKGGKDVTFGTKIKEFCKSKKGKWTIGIVAALALISGGIAISKNSHKPANTVVVQNDNIDED